MDQVQEAAIRAYWDDVWTRGDVGGVGRFYSPTFLLNGEETTTEDFADGVVAWLKHFTDFSASVDMVFSCGDKVVSRVIYRAIHSGDFKRLPATGRRIELSGIDVFVFGGGRVVEHWHETDHLEMFRQLGADVSSVADGGSGS